MSNDTNTRFIEGAYDRLADLLEFITPMTAAEVADMLVSGDLEGADALLNSLEAKYADDLR